ncbi:hypothetical protein YC2023_117120 [Brassica napus]
MNWSRSWSKFCESVRIVPSSSRSASGPWCWVGMSVMFLFDCWLAGWLIHLQPWVLDVAVVARYYWPKVSINTQPSLQFQTSRTHQSYFKNVARVRERKKVVDLRVWSILKTDTPPRRPFPSNRRFSTIVMRKLCPIQSVQGQSVPLMMKWRCCQELFQFHGFRSVKVLLDSPP